MRLFYRPIILPRNTIEDIEGKWNKNKKNEKGKKKKRKTEKDVFLFESETLAISQRVFFQKQTLRQDQFLNAMFINEKY